MIPSRQDSSRKERAISFSAMNCPATIKHPFGTLSFQAPKGRPRVAGCFEECLKSRAEQSIVLPWVARTLPRPGSEGTRGLSLEPLTNLQAATEEGLIPLTSCRCATRTYNVRATQHQLNPDSCHDCKACCNSETLSSLPGSDAAILMVCALAGERLPVPRYISSKTDSKVTSVTNYTWLTVKCAKNLLE